MIRTLSKHSPETKEFLKYIREDLKAHRVHLSFSRTRKVRFSKELLTAGFFQEPSHRKWGKIRIGSGNRKSINILVNLAHEYIHFLQWKNGDCQWTGGTEDFIEGESYILLEERTERDAIRLLREWGIPANYNAMRMRSKAYLAHLRRTET
jgi:hypothetical protein